MNKINKSTNNFAKNISLALFITLTIFVAEIVGGILSNSLALISDAYHMLIDISSLLISLGAFKIAKRELTLNKTYGYHRTEIIAAFFNSITLIFLAFYIFFQSYLRFVHPEEIHIKLMLLVAFIGLVANLIALFFLHKQAQENLNVKGAFLHILGDTLSSFGVIIGGIIIYFTQLFIVDAFISLIIGFMILYSALNLFKETMHILLEGTPSHLDVNQIIEKVKSINGVKEIHEIHIWTITSDMNALSCHLLVEEQPLSKSNEIMIAVNNLLKNEFKIKHTTLQLESKINTANCTCELNSLI